MNTHSDFMMSVFLNNPIARVENERIIRKHSKTFFFATGLLPEAPRAAIRALYAFCRETDDLVDRREATMADVENWQSLVKRPCAEQDHPTLLLWACVRDQYGVNPQYEQELIDGVRMDLEFSPFQTWNDLQLYCYHVASTVGLLSIPIIGLAKGVSFEQATPFAIQLDMALQLTNILRDVGEDLDRGRVYLPLEDLQRFDLSLEDVEQRVFDERFIQLMRFEIQRARDLYAQSLPGINLLHPAARPAVGAAALLYAAILDEIERLHYQVNNKRAHTSAWQKMRLLPAILWKIQRLPRLR